MQYHRSDKSGWQKAPTQHEHRYNKTALWRQGIKEIEGGHGSHVGIYFRFLRWCLILNTVRGGRDVITF
jgi:hypothetical protein